MSAAIKTSKISDIYMYMIYLSGFDKRYLQKFLATVSFEACSVLDHSFFFYDDLFSTKIPLKATVDQKTCVKYAVYNWKGLNASFGSNLYESCTF